MLHIDFESPATDVVQFLMETPSIKRAILSLDGHPDVLGELRSMFLVERPDIVELIDKCLELVALRIASRQIEADHLRDLSQRN